MAKLIVGVNDLATVNPELAKEWNFEKNGDLKPTDVTTNSGKKVWWICGKGHEWVESICNRTRNCNCPYCGNKKVLLGFNDLATTNPKLVIDWNYEKNDTTPQDYTDGSHKKVWWKCKNGHEWQSTIVNRKKGKGCPYCANQKILKGYNDLTTTNPAIAKEWNYEKNEMSPQDYVSGSSKKVWWKCEKGHEWQAIIDSRVRYNLGCPFCSNKRLWTGFNDLVTLNSEIINEWNYERNNKPPQDYTSHNGTKVWWICKQGHEWQTTINNRANGNGCPYCTNQKVLVGFNDLATVNPKLAKEWNYEKNGFLTPKMFTKGSNKKVWWAGKCGHEWQASIVNRDRGRGCPYCSGSKTERLAYIILREKGISFVGEKKFKQDMYISFYPFDIWIASKQQIIELDGIQHFTDKLDFFEQDTPFEKRVNHDNLKNDYCLKKGYPILRIPYTFNPDTEKNKIKTIIIEFLETSKVPQEIIDYYAQYDFSNYSQIAKEMNDL